MFSRRGKRFNSSYYQKILREIQNKTLKMSVITCISLLCSIIIYVFQVQSFNHQYIIIISYNILYIIHHDHHHLHHQLSITSSTPHTHYSSIIDDIMLHLDRVSLLLQQSINMFSTLYTCFNSVVVSPAHIHITHTYTFINVTVAPVGVVLLLLSLFARWFIHMKFDLCCYYIINTSFNTSYHVSTHYMSLQGVIFM
jgi:hypothetical protein